MDGAPLPSPGEDLGEDSTSGRVTREITSESSVPRRRRRRHRRHRTLGEKLRRHHAAARVRRTLALIFLGALIVLVSTYFAHTSGQNEPPPVQQYE